MPTKIYKCGFKHCTCSEELTSENSIMSGNRHYHNECFEIKNKILEIRDFYINNISLTVVVGQLVKVINTIIFSKNIPADYLLFALKYVVGHNINLNSPFGLHYIIDNKKIKDAYKLAEVKKPVEKVKVEIDDDFDFDTDVIAMPSNPQSGGFADILRRK